MTDSMLKIARRAPQAARFFFLLLALLLVSRGALARPPSCSGPPQCCPAEPADTLSVPATVQLGVLLVGLYGVDEKAGTWNADFYLSESWQAVAGFTPVTEIVNEVARQTEQFDTTEFVNGRCGRTRRIRSTLQSNYNLRTFPFDHQLLTLEFSDAWFNKQQAAYSTHPTVSDFDEEAKAQLSSWKVEDGLQYSRHSRGVKEDGGRVEYDYATFGLPVRRHVTFHLTKFFLPLLVIMVVAFSVFWIDPADLNSRVAVGVTCLLAAIAFQLAEAGSLPEVEYLTLADRVYAICYVSLALAIVMAVYGKSLSRVGQDHRATKVDRRCRLGFPLGTALAVLLGAVRAFSQ